MEVLGTGSLTITPQTASLNVSDSITFTVTGWEDWMHQEITWDNVSGLTPSPVENGKAALTVAGR